jgi:hypothetical protein
MNDWVAMKVTNSPEAKQTDRLRGHDVARKTPRAYREPAISRRRIVTTLKSH